MRRKENATLAYINMVLLEMNERDLLINVAFARKFNGELMRIIKCMYYYSILLSIETENMETASTSTLKTDLQFENGNEDVQNLNVCWIFVQ